MAGSLALGREPGAIDRELKTNRPNVALHTRDRESRMILFWLLWVSLVLGGLAGLLLSQGRLPVVWPRAARLTLPRRPAAGRLPAADLPAHRPRRGEFLPAPRVTTRPAAPPGPGT